MQQLANRVAVVTGGSSGIGRATALCLARQGAKVYTGDLQPRAENARLFAELGITEHGCDVRREADVARLIEAAAGAAGRLHIIVHSAGIVMVKKIPDVMQQEWDDCFDVNLRGAFFAAKHAIPLLRAAGGGAIVNVSSNAGLLPRAHDPVYSTSKAALIALTKSLALSHAADRIRVNAVCPGPVSETGIMDSELSAAADPQQTRRRIIAASPLVLAHGRMITPEEVAQAVLYLVSDASAMLTGAAIPIDGGKSLGVPPVAT